MDQVFEKLLEVRIWHDYSFLEEQIPERVPFSYRLGNLIEIIPSKRTKRVLRAHDLIFKPTQVGFMIVVKVLDRPGSDKNPTFSQFNERVKLSFFLRVKDTNITNITNIPLPEFSKYLFYCSNLQAVANTLKIDGQDRHFLSKPLPGFEAGRDYKMGDLIRASGKVYEVIKADKAGSDPSQAGATRPHPGWEEGKNSQYVTGADREIYVKKALLFDYEGPNRAPGQEVWFSLQNQFGEQIGMGFKAVNGEEVPIGRAVYPETGEKLKHSFIITDQAEGLYSLYLGPDKLEQFYLVPAGEVAAPLGVIELFHTPPGQEQLIAEGEAPTVEETPVEETSIPKIPDGFGFIDIEEEADRPLYFPRPIVYNLHFKSRLTYWHYIFSDKKMPTVKLGRPHPLSMALEKIQIAKKKDNNGKYIMDSNGKHVIVEVTGEVSGAILLPNPTDLNIQKVEQPEDKYISKIYV